MCFTVQYEVRPGFGGGVFLSQGSIVFNLYKVYIYTYEISSELCLDAFGILYGALPCKMRNLFAKTVPEIYKLVMFVLTPLGHVIPRPHQLGPFPVGQSVAA